MKSTVSPYHATCGCHPQQIDTTRHQLSRQFANIGAMRIVLFWLLFPWLIPQALYVRQTAPRFAAASGPTEGTIGSGDDCGEGEHVRLLAIGDSIVAGVGASELSKALIGQTAAALADSNQVRVSWQAIGVSGYDARKILDHLVPKLPQSPVDYIIVSVGVNDVTGLTGIRTWRNNLSELLQKLRTHSPQATIAVAGLPPLHGFPLLPQPLRAVLGIRARSLDDAAIAIVSSFPDMAHVALDFDPDPAGFAGDGYHPSEESYVEFGRYMADGLIASARGKTHAKD